MSGLNITQVERPACFPVSLEDAKAAGVIDVNTDDGLIERIYIPAATARAEAFLNRRLITQLVSVAFDSFCGCHLVLPVAPVLSIDGITYLDALGGAQTVSGAAFYVDTGNEPVALHPVYGVGWPASVSPRSGSVVVRAWVGYPSDPAAGSPATAEALRANIPAPIIAAILQDVSHLYENRGVLAASNLVEKPCGWEDLLWPFRLLV